MWHVFQATEARILIPFGQWDPAPELLSYESNVYDSTIINFFYKFLKTGKIVKTSSRIEVTTKRGSGRDGYC